MVICCLEDVLNIVDHLLLLFVATYSLAFRKMIAIHQLQFGLSAAIGGNAIGIEARIIWLKSNASAVFPGTMLCIMVIYRPEDLFPNEDNVFESKIHLLQFGLMATIDGNVMGIEAHIAQLKRDRIIAAVMVICCLEDVLNMVDHLLLLLLFVATYSLAFRKMIENGESHLVKLVMIYRPEDVFPNEDNVFETKIHLLQLESMAAIGGNVMGTEAHILPLRSEQ